jgi:hypothetical protein
MSTHKNNLYMQKSRVSIEQSHTSSIKHSDPRSNFHKTETSEQSKLGNTGRQANLVAVEEHPSGLFNS